MERIKTCNRCGTTTSLFYRKSGQCIECCKEITRARRLANPELKRLMDANYRERMGETLKAKKRAYQKANKEQENARCRAWYVAQGDRAKASAARWRLANPDLQKAAVKKWCQDNRGRLRASLMARKRAVKRATPSWSEPFFFEEAHDLAVRRTAATGIEWQVDHIEPINGKDVCGLHVPANIRVIPALANRRKRASRNMGNHWLGLIARWQTDVKAAQGAHENAPNVGQASAWARGTA